MPVTQDPIAFTDAMADLLRLPDETLAMSYIYLNRYRRFQTSSSSLDPLDEYVCLPSRPEDASLYALSTRLTITDRVSFISRRWH